MKRFVSTILILACTIAAFAQNPVLRQRLEIAEIEINDGERSLEVFRMEDNGQYYLSVGNLGIGTDLFQIQFDPLFELFIPLGGTLDESMEKLQDLKAFYKQARKTSTEVQGCLSAAYPNDKLEPITVTSRQFLGRILEFSVERDGLVRATYVPRADFNSLVTSVKLYRKIHPKEL